MWQDWKIAEEEQGRKLWVAVWQIKGGCKSKKVCDWFAAAMHQAGFLSGRGGGVTKYLRYRQTEQMQHNQFPQEADWDLFIWQEVRVRQLLSPVSQSKTQHNLHSRTLKFPHASQASLRFGSAALAWHASSAWAPNVMFFFLFFHSLLFLPALNLFGRHLQVRLHGSEPPWNFEDCHEQKLLRKSFSLLSAERGSARFHSQRQHKHCSPQPRPWYSCLFIISDTSRYMRAEIIQLFIQPGCQRLISGVSSACVTEYKMVFYKSSPKVVICFIMMQKKKKVAAAVMTCLRSARSAIE